MSTNIPAFPVLHVIDGNWVKEPRDEYLGISMRDYFAAAALSGPIIVRAMDETEKPEGRSDKEHIADLAYVLADAMLKERAKP